jgi:hypothetical protein
MVPSARTTGVEIFNPEGFAHDQKWTTQVLKMKYIRVERYELEAARALVGGGPRRVSGHRYLCAFQHVLELIENRVDGQI